MEMNASVVSTHHVDLSASYPGAVATLTSVKFYAFGLLHTARRFFRSDMPGTGKVEMYTCDPHNPEGSTTVRGWEIFAIESFHKYANEFNPTKVEAFAMIELAKASAGTYVPTHALGAIERAALLEF